MERLQEIFLHQETDCRRLVRRCAIAALILLVATQAEVIFGGASISSVNLINVTETAKPERVQFLPERFGRKPTHGYTDYAGSAYQSEPGAQFMARALWGGQSVYWNPYSAAGSFGVETVIDVKASPLSMAVAVFGGSDIAFHIAFLAYSYFGVFCILLLFTTQWRLSFVAAVAGGVVYLLNGYSVINTASNFSQIWLYFPVLTLALAGFAKTPRVMTFLGVAAGTVLLLSTTFLPTTISMFGTVMLVGGATAFAAAMAGRGSWRGGLGAGALLVCGQVAGALMGLAILAVLYLPIAEALRSMSTAEYYGARVFHPATLFNFISLFTPKHAFESYSVTERAAALRGNIAFHIGIVTALLISQAVRAWPPFHRYLCAALGVMLLLLVARMYGLPGFSAAVGAIPLLGNLGQQYLWIGLSAVATLLVPFGVHGLVRSGPRALPLAVIAVVILAALGYTAREHGVRLYPELFYVSVAVLLVMATVLMVLNLRRARAPVVPALAVVLLCFAELTFYVNHYRLARTDIFSDPPPYVRFLQRHAGLHRVASYGNGGIPPEFGSAFGVPQIGSMNFQLLPRYVDLFNRLILPDPAVRWTGFVTLVRARDTDRLNLAALDLVGTKYLTFKHRYWRLRALLERSGWRQAYEDEHFVIFENPAPLPRAYVTHALAGGRTTPVDLGRSPRTLTVSDDARLIDAARKLGIGEVPAEPAAGDAVSIARYDHARVEMAAHLARPGILVLSDTWHPNWRATVDGVPHHLGVVNQAFRGLALPAGRHVIEMTYRPRTLALAQGLTGFALLLAAVLFALRRRIDAAFAARFGLQSANVGR